MSVKRNLLGDTNKAKNAWSMIRYWGSKRAHACALQRQPSDNLHRHVDAEDLCPVGVLESNFCPQLQRGERWQYSDGPREGVCLSAFQGTLQATLGTSLPLKARQRQPLAGRHLPSEGCPQLVEALRWDKVHFDGCALPSLKDTGQLWAGTYSDFFEVASALLQRRQDVQSGNATGHE